MQHLQTESELHYMLYADLYFVRWESVIAEKLPTTM